MRDDFSKSTVDEIAKRAGTLCSNPECRVPTFGPKKGDEGFTNVGVAAHITAAAPGGPRYDPLLTSEQRRHQSNGIWLCQIHAKLVDSDEGAFTVKTLRDWKKNAEYRRFRHIVTLQGTPEEADFPIQEDLEFRRSLDLEEKESLGSIIDRIRASAIEDLAGFKRRLNWPTTTVALNLKVSDGNSTELFTALGLSSAIETFNQIVVVAPPGTGKTTTLIQATEAILSAGKSVAGFVPLSEWSSQSDSFLQSFIRRHAFSGIAEGHLKLLAHHGRLVLIMDGWNELDAQAKKRARHGIESLFRDFPNLRITISTRLQAMDVPTGGTIIEISALSESQQIEIARSLRGPEGEGILDHAWRTTGIADLVRIPLYLTTLLGHTSGPTLPTTKEEVLRLFVQEHERAPDKREALYATALSFHSRILTALAVEATHAATTTLSDAKARATVKSVQDRLALEGQIQLWAAPQPAAILDTLVNHHLLTRSGEATKELSFQHQQFQEWYASFAVEELMYAAANGEQEAKKRLRVDMLNVPEWEESILFASERASRAGAFGAQAVAAVIVDSLGIDPFLAADMIVRSSPDVWEYVKERVISFVERWHAKGKVDRAVHFMVSTGRGEFAEKIWPLISNQDSKVYLVAGRRFRPSVLGSKVRDRLASLPAKVREQIVSEVIYQSGGMDGIELGASIAKTDPSPKVKASAVNALLFRRADRLAAEILRDAPDEVWGEVASSGHWDDIDDSACAARFMRERQRLIENEANPLRKANLLLSMARRTKTEGLGQEIAQLIMAPDFPARDYQAGWMIQEAYGLYASDVTTAILNRLQAGMEIPHGSQELLQKEGIEIEEGPVVGLVLNSDTPKNVADVAVTVVGSQTIGRVVDELIATHRMISVSGKPIEESLRKKFWHLSDLISLAGTNPFFNAVLSRASTTDPSVITLLAQCVVRHRRHEPIVQPFLQGSLLEGMIASVKQWGENLLTNPLATRYQLAELAGVIERLAAPRLLGLLKRMLVEDLARWQRARSQAVIERKAGQQVNSDSHHSYTNLYRAAFAAIATKEVIELMKGYLPDAGFTGFGEDAAWVLKEIHERNKATPRQNGFKGFRSGIEFSQVRANREIRHKKFDQERSQATETILEVVRKLLQPDASESDYRHALKLACIALSMPYGEQSEIISKLLAIALPISEKRALLTVLVQAGEIISADLVLDGIKNLLEEAKTKSWLLDENAGRLEGWLRLLPFTDRPTSSLDALKLLDPNMRHPWKLRGFLSSLGYAPSVEAEHVLKALILEDARFLMEHEWYFALDSRGTVSAGLMLLELMSTGQCTESGDHSWNLITKLATYMAKHLEVRREAYAKYSSPALNQGRTLIGRAIAEAPDEDGIIVLLLGHASLDIIQSAIRNVAIGKRTSSDFDTTQQIISMPLAELRRKLFTIGFANIPESGMAKLCLDTIDEIRDDYGFVESEPRHPDITSGLPWPSEADAGTSR